MNGEPLPANHGFPARLIVPGLFGYVSATKWLAEIELDHVGRLRRLLGAAGLVEGGADPHAVAHRRRRATAIGSTAGPVPIAGVAWAPDRGIGARRGPDRRGRVDRGGAEPRRSRTRPGCSSRTAGTRRPATTSIQVRATDGTGEVQTDQRTPPAPDGARGHHTIQVSAASAASGPAACPGARPVPRSGAGRRSTPRPATSPSSSGASVTSAPRRVREVRDPLVGGARRSTGRSRRPAGGRTGRAQTSTSAGVRLRDAARPARPGSATVASSLPAALLCE